jgi:dephospho-CoA kinase
MKVIGTVGLNGSGKDEVVNYLHRRCGIPVLSMGDIVRDIAREENIEPTRPNLHEISRRYILRHGKDYFARSMIERIAQSGWDAVGITGIRTPSDVRAFKEHFGRDFLLIHVKVGDPRIRFERMQARGEARDPPTYGEFEQQDRTEEEIFHVSESIRYADTTVYNDSTLEILHQRIEEAIVQAGYCKEGRDMPYKSAKVPEDLEARIKELMDRGLTNAEIAAHLREDAKEANITTPEELMGTIRSIRDHHSG